MIQFTVHWSAPCRHNMLHYALKNQTNKQKKIENVRLEYLECQQNLKHNV